MILGSVATFKRTLYFRYVCVYTVYVSTTNDKCCLYVNKSKRMSIKLEEYSE